jgi:hypothetical protein
MMLKLRENSNEVRLLRNDERQGALRLDPIKGKPLKSLS